MNRTLWQCLLFTVVLAFCALQSAAQRPVFQVKGIVHGYEYFEHKGLLKRNKPAILQGVLENVNVQVYLDQELIEETATNAQGSFDLELQFNQLYRLLITREGYNELDLYIDTRAFPLRIQKGGFAFSAAEFVLNSYKDGTDSTLNRTLGRLYYHGKANELRISSFDGKGDLNSISSGSDAVYELLKRSLSRNNERIKDYRPLPKPKVYTMTNSTQPPFSADKPEETAKPYNGEDSLTLPYTISVPGQAGAYSSPEELAKNSKVLDKAKEQLAMARLKAKTQRDSLEIIRWEKEINSAEREIKNARLIIGLQADKLSAQENSLYLLISMIVMLGSFSAIVYIYYRQKQRTSALLEDKNRQITDSISYARRIQQSILIQESDLQKLLPESFVFLRPKDIVSGDFYFFAEVKGKQIIVAADCTGHGVPGAFMSLIGHRLLREIILEKTETSPALILEQLHRGILDALRQEEHDEHTQDGMDVSIVTIDPGTYTLTYAGAMNPVYLVKDQELFVLKADVRSVGGKTLRNGFRAHERSFTNHAINYIPGSMLYLFTDGYMDQFGGPDNKKLNTRRFKELLMDIQPVGAFDQREAVKRLFNDWKGEEEQTDDVLVLGIRLL